MSQLPYRIARKLLAITLALIVLPLMIASDCGDGMVDHGAPLIYVSPPVWSSDGGSVLMDDGGKLVIVSSDGTRIKIVRADDSDSRSVVGNAVHFSPDATRVASTNRSEPGRLSELFLGARSTVAIETISIDGTDRRRLTKGSIDFDPVWSPDGTMIAFNSAPAVRRGDVLAEPRYYVIDADGSNVREISGGIGAPGTVYHQSRRRPELAVWSPDSRRLAYATYESDGEDASTHHTIYAVNSDGSGLVRVAKIPYQAFWGLPMEWSPDSRSIFFIPLHVGSVLMYKVSADGGEVYKLWELDEIEEVSDSMVWDMTLSPADDRILFATSDESGCKCQRLYVVNTDGTGLREIHRRPGTTQPFSAAWSPDGSRITIRQSYYGYEDDVLVLFTTAPDGFDKVELVRFNGRQLVAANVGTRK